MYIYLLARKVKIDEVEKDKSLRLSSVEPA